MSKNINLAVIAGDGIGPEVVAQGIRVLDKVAAKYDTTFQRRNMTLALATGIAQEKFFLIRSWQRLQNLM